MPTQVPYRSPRACSIFLLQLILATGVFAGCNGAKQLLLREDPGCVSTNSSVQPGNAAQNIRQAVQGGDTCQTTGAGGITIVSNTNDYLSSAGFTSTNLTWSMVQTGIAYSVRVGGADCTSGTVVTGANATGITAGANIATTVPVADLTVGANTVRICAELTPGNFIANTYTLTRDETAPTITLRETQDLNGNGKIDAIKITFAEPVLDSSVVAGSFTIAGYAAPAFSATTNGDVANDNVIYITFTELAASCGPGGNTGCDTGFTPNLTVAASAVRDRSNIPVAASGPTITTDRALPIIVAATAENLRRKLIVVFSEPVYNAAGAPACPSGDLAASYFTYNNNAAGGATALNATITKGCGSNNRIILRTTTKFRRADLNTASGDSIAPTAATIFDANGNLAVATAKNITERKNMDFNGDGIPDLIIAASSSQTGLNDRGEVYVYFGSASNISGNCAAYPCTLNATTHPDVIIQGAAASDRLGTSVSSPGDVNGDGFDDLIVGASSAAGGGTSRGEAYIFFGSATNISGDCASYPCTLNATTHPDVKIQGAVNSDFLGTVATAGDINDDGVDDFVVGASGSDSGAANAGEAYIYFGNSSNISGNCGAYPCTLNATTHPDIKVQGAATTIGVGQPGLGATSDINNDEVDDLVVSAPGANGGGTSRGEIYVYFGSATNISGDCGAYPCILNSAGHPDLKIQGTFDNDLIESASLNGDFNGDGVTDLLIGAPNRLTSAVMGESYILFGGSNFSGDCGAFPCTLQTQTHADVIMQGGADHGDVLNNLAEISVASVGDINNDGIDDISIGSELATGAGGQAAWRGQMKFFFGSATNISGDCPFYPCTLNSTAHPDIKIIGPSDGMQLGRASARAGDVNGDGINDFLVSAHRANGVRGEAYVYFGGVNVSGNCAAYPCVLDNTGHPDVKIQGANSTDFLGDGLY